MANAKPSFSPEDLEAIIKSNPEMLAKIFAAMDKTAKQDRDDSKIVNAFLKAGYKDVVLLDTSKPLAAKENENVSVLTYRKWMELGRKVKPGEKSLNIRGYHLRLFHKSQTEIATTAERKAYHKRQQDAEAKRQAKAGEGAQASA
jgi:N-terminal domain of anti-restriction factor ArdC